MTLPNTPQKRLLNLNQLREKLSLSRTAIYKALDQGSIPKPIYQGNRPYWVEGQIDEMIDAAVARVNQGEAA